MRTKRFWDNRYNDFCDKVLGEEVRLNQSFMERCMDEMVGQRNFSMKAWKMVKRKRRKRYFFSISTMN